MASATICKGNPIVILGGGLSGLSTAYYLTKLPPAVRQNRQIILVESRDTVGGWVQTARHDDGVIHELGPRAIQSVGTSAPNTLELINELGLSSKVIGHSSTAKLRYILKQGKLVPLPHSFISSLQRSPVFSQIPPLLYLFREKFKKTSLDTGKDYSLYDMVSDRFSQELAENLADPFCRGITAGDARQTSVQALFPRIHQALQKGSLFDFMKETTPPSEYPFNTSVDNKLLDYVKSKGWRSWTLETGLGTIGEKLSCVLKESENVQVITSTSVKRMTVSTKDKIDVTITNDTGEEKLIKAQHVFSSLPAFVLNKIISSPSPATSQEGHLIGEINKLLDKINAVDVAVICIEYPGKSTRANGFGFLVPSSESSSLLGVTFDSSVFPQHDDHKDITRVTAMLGGAWFNRLFSGKSADEIAHVAIKETSSLLNFRTNPLRVTTHIHKSCIPQYTLDHAERVAKLKELSSQVNISLVGASYEGVSVNDVILSARRAVQDWQQLNKR